MNNYFDQAFAYVLKNEGAIFTDDPRDSGGPTKYGITKKTLEAFVKRPVTLLEMRMLTIENVKPIYLTCYWLPLSCDKIESLPIATCVFDTAVLYGVKTAAVYAQKAAARVSNESLKLDGILGDKSVSLINSVNAEEFLRAFHRLVLFRITSVILVNPKDEVYRKGWTSRADRLLTLVNMTPVIDKRNA